MSRSMPATNFPLNEFYERTSMKLKASFETNLYIEDGYICIRQPAEAWEDQQYGITEHIVRLDASQAKKSAEYILSLAKTLEASTEV